MKKLSNLPWIPEFHKFMRMCKIAKILPWCLLTTQLGTVDSKYLVSNKTLKEAYTILRPLDFGFSAGFLKCWKNKWMSFSNCVFLNSLEWLWSALVSHQWKWHIGSRSTCFGRLHKKEEFHVSFKLNFSNIDFCLVTNWVN